MKTYKYFQPEYVAKFQCDGQKCGAHCCRRWTISIDKKTYKKYSHLKPKSAAQKITRNITKREGYDDYQIKLDKNLSCPFLTEDNLCSIQKNHGEEFLSSTCVTYPRLTYDVGLYHERALTLTCSVVAEMVLLEKNPLAFEIVEVSELIHNNLGRMAIDTKNIDQSVLDKVVPIQQTAIFILQERSLKIDQRLMMLGLYLDKVDEILNKHKVFEIDEVNSVYQKSDFLAEQAKQFAEVIKFNAHDHIKIMLGIFEKLYGGNNVQNDDDRILLDALKVALKINPDENGTVSISEVTQNYNELAEEREKFLQKFSTVFENYLVNEFFVNCYPFRFYSELIFNYDIFVTFYKMLEFLTFAASISKDINERDLMNHIIWYAVNTDHNIDYINKIIEYLREQNDLIKIMRSMLQV